jgi:hypothetical protein
MSCLRRKMTPERWKQISQLYEAAHSRPSSERSAFLAEACAGDEELRREVGSLLEQSRSLKALDALIPAFAEQVMGDDGGAKMLGRRFGTYLVHERIAVGGMGELFYFHGSSQFGAVKILQNPVPAPGAATDLWPAGLINASRVEPTEDDRFIALVRAEQSPARNVAQLHVVLNWFEELEQRLAPEN